MHSFMIVCSFAPVAATSQHAPRRPHAIASPLLPPSLPPLTPLARMHGHGHLLELRERRRQVVRVQLERAFALFRRRAKRIADDPSLREIAVVGGKYEVLVALELDVGGAVEF